MKETKIKRDKIFEGKVISVYKDEVRCENERLATREIVHHNGGASILALTELEEVILIKQFRYVVGDYIYELPAGKIEKGEDPLACAIREFTEETGYYSSDMKFLTKIYPTPGYSDEIIYIYMTKSFVKKETKFDFDEDIKTYLIPLSEVELMILRNEIMDSKTIAAIAMYNLLKK